MVLPTICSLRNTKRKENKGLISGGPGNHSVSPCVEIYLSGKLYYRNLRSLESSILKYCILLFYRFYVWRNAVIVLSKLTMHRNWWFRVMVPKKVLNFFFRRRYNKWMFRCCFCTNCDINRNQVIWTLNTTNKISDLLLSQQDFLCMSAL